jgi:broad specificity phosphatase PhoE
MLHLVRHGRPVVRPDTPAAEWELDPEGYPAIEGLRRSSRLPEGAAWYSSPEPKALETARRLTGQRVTVVDALREHERGPTPWFDDARQWRALVRRAFSDPDTSALEGWEPLAATRDRLLPAVRRLLAEHRDGDVVLAGHGTAWTLLVAELTGEPPDLDAWAALRMPDVWTVDV